MSPITFSGISSGIDSGAIIDQLVSAERAPIRRLEQSRSDYQSQLSILQSVNSKLQSLQTKASGLKTIGDFLSYTTTTADDEKVTATASGTATPGRYNIEITQLAKAERTYSDAFTDETEEGAAGAGTLTIDLASEDAVDVEILATDTLEDIVNKINASDAEVSAALISTQAGYKIQVNANDTGTDHAITFSESGSLILNLDVAGNQYQAAQNAEFSIDGFDIISQSNEVSDTISGVTLSLLEQTTGAVEISVSPEPTQIKDRVTEFVDAYNEVMGLVHTELDFNGTAKGSDRLAGDSTLRSIQFQLSSTLSSAVDNLTGGFSALSQLGITTSSDGSLTVDETDLEAAIAEDPVGVAQVFAGTADHSVDGIADQLDDLIETFVDFSDGILSSKKKGLNRTITNINQSIERQEESVALFEQRMIQQFTDLEVAMSKLTSQSNFMASQSFLW